MSLNGPGVGRPPTRVQLAVYSHYVEKAPMNLLQGQDATCPHCWETINLTLDLSIPEQSYIEDCPVCCRPMRVSYSSADGELVEFSVESAE
jgi:cysteine-rich CPXCG protein